MGDPVELEPDDAEQDMPQLMEAIPGLYPGAWGPPAETLTVASILVSVIGVAFLLHKEVDKALFRFPFQPYLLAGPAMVLSLLIATVGKSRPGHSLPRIWALLLTLGCALMTVVGAVEQVRTVRSSPLVHIFSFVVLLSALALAPRLLRISPFSFWVQHIAPVSLVWVALLCIISGTIVRNAVIRRETERITKSIDLLNNLSAQIRVARSSDLTTAGNTLEQVSLPAALPDSYAWIAANALKEERPTLLPDLTRAVGGLIVEVGEAFQRKDIPSLSSSRVTAERLGRRALGHQSTFQQQHNARIALLPRNRSIGEGVRYPSTRVSFGYGVCNSKETD